MAADRFAAMIAGLDQYAELLKLLAGVISAYERELVKQGVTDPTIRGPLLLAIQERIIGSKGGGVSGSGPQHDPDRGGE